MVFAIFERNINYKEVIKQCEIFNFVLKFRFFSFFMKSMVAASDERFWPRDSDKYSGSYVLILGSEYSRRSVITCSIVS